MNFWIPYLLGIFSCAASLGVFLLGHCLRLAAERDRWMRDACVMAAVLIQRNRPANEPPMKIVMRGGIPVVQPVEWPKTLEVK